MRLAMVIYLADSLSRRQGLLKDLDQAICRMPLIIGGAMGLIILQPGVSTALALGNHLLSDALSRRRPARASRRIGLACLPVLYVLVFVIGYRKERVMSFLNPTDDVQGASYQITSR